MTRRSHRCAPLPRRTSTASFSRRSAATVFPAEGRTARHVPIVLIDNMFHDVEMPCVLHDNEHDARLLVTHLVEHGHSAIACVTGPLGETSAAEGSMGTDRRWTRRGSPVENPWCASPTGKARKEYAATMDLLRDRPSRPTAIFYANSQQLLGGYKALNELRLRMPMDIAVVGFDHPDVIDALSPRPTVLKKSSKGSAPPRRASCGTCCRMVRARQGPSVSEARSASAAPAAADAISHGRIVGEIGLPGVEPAVLDDDGPIGDELHGVLGLEGTVKPMSLAGPCGSSGPAWRLPAEAADAPDRIGEVQRQ